MPSLEQQFERIADAAVEEYKALMRQRANERSRQWRRENPDASKGPRPKRRVAPERLAQIRELAERGLTQAEVGQEVGCSRAEAGRIMRDYGIAHRPVGGQIGNQDGPPRAPKDVRVLEMRERGMTLEQIAAELGVSPRTIGNRLRALR